MLILDSLSKRDQDALTLLELWSAIIYIMIVANEKPNQREMRYLFAPTI